MKTKRIKYIFEDKFAPHVGTEKCAKILQAILERDDSNLTVYCHIKYPPAFNENRWIIETCLKEQMGIKSPPLTEEELNQEGEYYVYTYDEMPSKKQLDESYLKYVRYEEEEL